MIKTTAPSTEDAQAEQDQPTYETVTCEDCGGSGIDPGSLYEPEPCPPCKGAGTLLAPEEVEKIRRRWMGRAKTATTTEDLGIWSPEERIWKVGE
ncbi:MAG TPA: hypothetical protein VNH18_29505 [Bryobacteraceae bacterium]|nr:hypothetical protein [Blastocatellia bacterium]HXJ43455.1 hypothetical protein [Bryobacteraceae bacterium]